MPIKNLILLFLLLFISFPNIVLSEILHKIRVVNPNEKILRALSDEFELIHRHQNSFDYYVLNEKMPKFYRIVGFKKHSPKVFILEKDVNQRLRHNSLVDYKKYPEVLETMETWKKTYPQWVRTFDYGKSRDLNPLRALVLNPNNLDEAKSRNILITGATHGDELITVELVLHSIEYLLKNYPSNPTIQKIFLNKIITFIPVVSPDSFNKRQRYIQGLDPNRAYPIPPELKSRYKVGVIEDLMKLFEQKKFYSSMDYHAYGKMLMFPWGYTTDSIQPEDENHFKNLSEYFTQENGYLHGQISTTIYIAPGSSVDFYYFKYKTWAFGVEVGTDKAPPISDVKKVFQETESMLLKYLSAI